MNLIENRMQLIANIEKVEEYLAGENLDDQVNMRGYIQRGACFVAYKINDETRFVPSRFIGYVNNSLDDHGMYFDIDGRETNKAISSKAVLGEKETPSPELAQLYIEYCLNLGIVPNKRKKKFWTLDLEADFSANLELTGDFPEGKLIEKIHRTRERNSLVIQKAKDLFKAKFGKLFCQICAFDFETVYGSIGSEFIEAHHTVPVSEMGDDHHTRIEDIAMVCSNCHRMIHRRRPWLRMDEIKNLIGEK